MACWPVYDFIDGTKRPAGEASCAPEPRRFQFDLLRPSAAAIEFMRRHERMLMELTHHRSRSAVTH
jgi:hypothetical protein